MLVLHNNNIVADSNLPLTLPHPNQASFMAGSVLFRTLTPLKEAFFETMSRNHLAYSSPTLAHQDLKFARIATGSVTLHPASTTFWRAASERAAC